MSTVTIKERPLLGSLATSRVEHNPVQVISRTASEPAKNVRQPAEAPFPKAAAWDPHEIWLNRVKKPREQRSS